MLFRQPEEKQPVEKLPDAEENEGKQGEKNVVDDTPEPNRVGRAAESATPPEPAAELPETLAASLPVAAAGTARKATRAASQATARAKESAAAKVSPTDKAMPPSARTTPAASADEVTATRGAIACSAEVAAGATRVAAESESDSDVEIVLDEAAEDECLEQEPAALERTPTAQPAPAGHTQAPMTRSKAQAVLRSRASGAAFPAVAHAQASPAQAASAPDSEQPTAQRSVQDAPRQDADKPRRPSTRASQRLQQRKVSPAAGRGSSGRQSRGSQGPAAEDDHIADLTAHANASRGENDDFEEAQDVFETPSHNGAFATPGSALGTSMFTAVQHDTAYKTGSEHLNSMRLCSTCSDPIIF
jgi:ribonuclease E